ncbi:hypothetical protein EDB89DRAFT_1908973 [Lactarius sanguifluus]|nr:hypothetical protein EDB89DRAFT_1908973 [Lactarius sanguifluus]
MILKIANDIPHTCMHTLSLSPRLRHPPFRLTSRCMPPIALQVASSCMPLNSTYLKVTTATTTLAIIWGDNNSDGDGDHDEATTMATTTRHNGDHDEATMAATTTRRLRRSARRLGYFTVFPTLPAVNHVNHLGSYSVTLLHVRCQVFLYEQDASKRPIVRNVGVLVPFQIKVKKVVGSAKIMIRSIMRGILYCPVLWDVRRSTWGFLVIGILVSITAQRASNRANKPTQTIIVQLVLRHNALLRIPIPVYTCPAGRVVLICLRDRRAGAGQKCVVFIVRNRLGTDLGLSHTVKQKVNRRVHPTGQAGQAMGGQRNSPKIAVASAADGLLGFIEQLLDAAPASVVIVEMIVVQVFTSHESITGPLSCIRVYLFGVKRECVTRSTAVILMVRNTIVVMVFSRFQHRNRARSCENTRHQLVPIGDSDAIARSARIKLKPDTVAPE